MIKFEQVAKRYVDGGGLAPDGLSLNVEPGEMVIAGPEGFRVERYWPEQKKAFCFFEWVYFSSLASSLEGRSVYKVRNAIGRELAGMESLPDRDEHLVLAVPETAETVAQSFAFHLGLPVIHGLLRNRYVGRTFIDGANRGENVRLKFTRAQTRSMAPESEVPTESEVPSRW